MSEATQTDTEFAPPPPEPWDFWDDGAREPALNMALDEALLLTATGRGRPLLRFYRWDRTAVTIGHIQTYRAAPAQGFVVVRRPTGGGVVFHDHDFTYSVVAPVGHWLTGLERMKSYHWVNRAVLTGLEACAVPGILEHRETPASVDRSTMVCFQSPTRYDVMLKGRKVAGSAQRRTRDGILHQGSLHFGGPLPVPREDLSRRLCGGFRSTLRAELAEFAPTPELLELARKLADSRYATDAWTRKR